MKGKSIGRRAFQFLYEQKAIAAIIVIMLAMIFVNPLFFSKNNLIDILKSATVMITIGCGLTPVIICHACDLSLGGQMCMSGIITIMLMPYMSLPLCILIAVAAGCLVGYINGFLVVHQKTEPFVITLGMGTLLKGINQQLTDAHPIASTNQAFFKFGTGKLFGIPYIVFVMIAAIIFTTWLLRYTQFGRNCFAVGGDYDVAEYSGINARRTKWMAFVYCGFMTAIAGILLSARLASGASTHGETTALLANCGAVLGGTSFAGGVGGPLQSAFGILLFSVLENALGMSSMSAYLQEGINGLLIVVIIGIDCYVRRREREAV